MQEPDKITGKTLQYNTIFGRMLSVTIWPEENMGNFFPGLAKMSQGAHRKAVDNISNQFYRFYSNFQEFLKKILKQKELKDKVLIWFRMLIN